jgi:hypothetical protein
VEHIRLSLGAVHYSMMALNRHITKEHVSLTGPTSSSTSKREYPKPNGSTLSCICAVLRPEEPPTNYPVSRLSVKDLRRLAVGQRFEQRTNRSRLPFILSGDRPALGVFQIDFKNRMVDALGHASRASQLGHVHKRAKIANLGEWLHRKARAAFKQPLVVLAMCGSARISAWRRSSVANEIAFRFAPGHRSLMYRLDEPTIGDRVNTDEMGTFGHFWPTAYNPSVSASWLKIPRSLPRPAQARRGLGPVPQRPWILFEYQV